jgi:hypothetical protein
VPATVAHPTPADLDPDFVAGCLSRLTWWARTLTADPDPDDLAAHVLAAHLETDAGLTILAAAADGDAHAFASLRFAVRGNAARRARRRESERRYVERTAAVAGAIPSHRPTPAPRHHSDPTADAVIRDDFVARLGAIDLDGLDVIVGPTARRSVLAAGANGRLAAAVCAAVRWADRDRGGYRAGWTFNATECARLLGLDAADRHVRGAVKAYAQALVAAAAA